MASTQARSTLSPSPTFAPRTRSQLTLHLAETGFDAEKVQPKGSQHTGVGLAALSPVTPAGTYEFDRVLKSGRVLKRRKRTNAWKPVYLVLRPSVLSVYTDKDETCLRHRIGLVDINAVALRTNDKRKGEHDGCFGLYTPARNYHFEADTLIEAEQWVTMIRAESRLDQDEMNLLVSSPEEQRRGIRGFGRFHRTVPVRPALQERDGSSSPEPLDRRTRSGNSVPKLGPMRSTSTVQELSAPEAASYSDFSDTPFGTAADAIPMSKRDASGPSSNPGLSSSQRRQMYMAARSPGAGRFDRSEAAEAFDEADRIIQQGHLLCLRSRSGVRKWKQCWTVLRGKNISLYKSDEEYSALLILPISSMVDVGDIDPVSKTKRFCMQIITDDRTYRFCATSEEDLSRWVGSLKSVLARRKEASSKARQQ